MEFFSLDLETTGLEPGRDEILEIAWVRFVDGRIRDRFQSLVRVERVPPAISSLTGIEPGDLADAPPLREVLPGVLEALAGRAVVAHNAPFDRAFLEAAAERLGLPFPVIHWVDTLALARALWPERRDYSLNSLRELVGELRRGHRALSDAEATGKLFLEELATLSRLPLEERLRFRGLFPKEIRPAVLSYAAEALAEPQGTLDEIFELLRGKLPGFQLRPQQRAYAELVERALERGGTYLLEAGPGTGKTFGYLIPILGGGGVRTVISTRTKTLQEQLWYKDIPALVRAMGIRPRLALLKGRENYPCLWRLERERGLFSGELVERLREWIERSETWDLAEASALFPGARGVLERIRDRPQRCLGKDCPFLAECPSRRARERAREADLVVVNHSLLAAHVRSGGGLLGEFDCLVVDEAHALPQALREGLTRDFSPEGLRQLLVELQGVVGEDLRSLKRAREALDGFTDGIRPLIPPDPRAYGREEGLRYLSLAQGLLWSLWDLVGELEETITGLGPGEGGELRGIYRELRETVETGEWILGAQGEGYTFWHEAFPSPVFHATPTALGPLLRDPLWGKIPCVVLTSATLAAGHDPGVLVEELGLVRPLFRSFPGSHPTTGVGVYLMEGQPHPDAPDYPGWLAGLLRGILEATGRKVLALFTSRELLLKVHGLLGEGRIFAQGVQGEAGEVVRRFREADPPALLLGLDSLWEGVDLPGEELEVLVITRLPFPNPRDPLVAARAKDLLRQGRDPFLNLFLPRALLRLRQGVGRLLRTPTDRGAIVIADRRIVTKRYGPAFVRVLPREPQRISSPEELFLALRELFG